MPQIPNQANIIKRENIQLRGINYTNNYQDGELADCKNICIDKYPYIGTEKTNRRKTGTGYTDVTALTSYKTPITFANDKIYINGVEFTDSIPSNEKQTAIVNGQMFVSPDDKLVSLKNTYNITSEDTSNVSDINRLYDWFNKNNIYAAGTHTFYAWGGETAPGNIAYEISEYSEDLRVKLYKITSDGYIKYYNGYSAQYFAVSRGDYVCVKWTTYSNHDYYPAEPTKITIPEEMTFPSNAGGLAYFSEPQNNLNGYVAEDIGIDEYASLTLEASAPITRSLSSLTTKCYRYNEYLGKTVFDKSFDGIFKVGDAVEVIQGDTQTTGTVSEVAGYTISVSGVTFVVGKWYCFKKMERPDFFCECNNRLWCCNNTKQLIYASSQGKPDDFVSDMGSAVGSYQLTVGDPDPFTACCKYESSILFFKQNRIYKILGSSPKNYEMYSYEIEGVKEGCHKSLCTINGVLYFVGLHGVYAYSGGVPMLISSNFGDMEMENAVGGTDGERYYLSFTSNGTDYLFTYEPRYNIWLKKDNVKIVDFARTSDGFYRLDSDKNLYEVGTGETPDDMDWYVQFKPFYETIEGKKRYSKLIIRANVSKKAYMSVKIRTDGGVWNEIGIIKGNTESTQTMRIPIARCDKFEFRIEGQGKAEILSIMREFEIGGERE